MQSSLYSRRGQVTSAHSLASQAGLSVLRDGGNAIEAAIAAAATLSVVAPHMNGLGGDGFWIIAEPGKPPLSIDASGASAALANLNLFPKAKSMPERGGLAALTVAGAVSGWQLALDLSQSWGGGLPLERLLEDAISYAREGFCVSPHLNLCTQRDATALRKNAPLAKTFLNRNKALPVGNLVLQPALADTLENLAEQGFSDFYRGDVARAMAQDLAEAGSPLVAEDLARHRGMRRRPLSMNVTSGTVFSTAPPAQGLAAMILLGLFKRLKVTEVDCFAWVHGLIEATKIAYGVRDTHLADPMRMSVHATTYLHDEVLDQLAQQIDPHKARGKLETADEGDTAYVGVIDGQGRAVSLLQSLYKSFGSGVLLPQTGIVWHNRGTAFSLDANSRNCLEPRKRPRHTLAPAFARLKDGRSVVWGTLGADAQPQILAQLFTRMIVAGQSPQAALNAPRFALMGDKVLVEDRFDRGVVAQLVDAGHNIEYVGPFDWRLGQAGALIRKGDGAMEGATDPRSDGAVVGW